MGIESTTHQMRRAIQIRSVGLLVKGNLALLCTSDDVGIIDADAYGLRTKVRDGGTVWGPSGTVVAVGVVTHIVKGKL